MAVWSDLSSAFLTDGLSNSLHFRQLRDNITAFAEQASGSPNINGTGIQDNSIPYTKFNGLSAPYAHIDALCYGIGVTLPLCKVVSMGAWNMETTASLNVAHGVSSLTNILSVSGTIRNDDLSRTYTIPGISDDPGRSDNIYFDTIGATNVLLQRGIYSIFNSSEFNSTGINRGYLAIHYLA